MNEYSLSSARSACAELHALIHKMERLRYPLDLSTVPRNGVYVLFEKGETGHGGDRIVRVGTHTGDGRLRSRLKQHFVNENKDSSVFRKNIGRAILNQRDDPFLPSWETRRSSRGSRSASVGPIDMERQAEIEKEVSAYMRAYCSLVVFQVRSKEQRLMIESRLIATVSRCDMCGASPGWLGTASPKSKIRQSGLWLVNELYKEPLSDTELKWLATIMC